MKYKDYNDLAKGLQKLPSTWYPDLIRRMAITAYEKKVFVEGGASVFIKKSVESPRANFVPLCPKCYKHHKIDEKCNE